LKEWTPISCALVVLSFPVVYLPVLMWWDFYISRMSYEYRNNENPEYDFPT
jgi:hypothetical protein